VKNKSRLGLTLAGDYTLVASFYLLLALTGKRFRAYNMGEGT
jgi:hypothetical protein